jgi:hypothetical protein
MVRVTSLAQKSNSSQGSLPAEATGTKVVSQKKKDES